MAAAALRAQEAANGKLERAAKAGEAMRDMMREAPMIGRFPEE
jgi:hypothetical protein